MLVVVAPVAGDPDDADRPAAPGVAVRGGPDPAGLRLRLGHHPVDEIRELPHPVDVVAVVDHHPDAADVEQVEPARCLEERRRERPEALADVVEVGSRRPGGRRRGQRIRHVHPGPPAERRRDQVGVQDRHRPGPVAEDDQLALGSRLEDERGVATGRVAVDAVVAVLALVGGHAEQDDPAGTVPAHPVDVAVVGVEDRAARSGHGLDDDALDVRQLADRVDPAEPEMVAGDVRHDRDVVAVVAQALTQDPAPGDLEDGGVDGRVLENHLGRLRARHVALLNQPAVDHDAVGRGHPDPFALQLEDVGDHPDGGRLPVRAGDGDDRDPRWAAGREQAVDHRPGDVLRLALGRVGVHPEARRGIDLDDRAARLADRGRDVGADEVDAGDVEPDDLGRRLRDLDIVRMRLDRPVDRGPPGRHVAGQGELHEGVLRRHVVEPEALVAEERLGRLVDLDPGQDLLVADAAPRIGIGGVDQLADAVLAVADHPRRHALGDRRDLPADDEAAVVVPRDVALDDEVAATALRAGAMERGPDGLLGAEIEVDASTVIAVERLDDARVTDPERRLDGRVLGIDDRALGDGQAGRVQQAVRQALVARDVDGDPGRLRGHRRPDPLLVDTEPELHERVAVEADVGDVARRGLVEDRLGRRPERGPLGEPDQALELRHEVDRHPVVGRCDEMVDEGDGDLAVLDPYVLLAVLVVHVVAAVLADRPGLAVADVRAGEVLELQRDVLGDVASPRPLAETGDEATPAAEGAGVVLEARQQLDQRLGEAGDLVARELLERPEVDEHPHDRLARPVVRTAEDPRLEDPEAWLRTADVRWTDRRAAARPRGRRRHRGRRERGRRERVWRCGSSPDLLLARLGCGPSHGSLLRSDRVPECTRRSAPGATALACHSWTP